MGEGDGLGEVRRPAVAEPGAGRPQRIGHGDGRAGRAGQGRRRAAAAWYLPPMPDLTYSAVGMTARDDPPPAGFRALRVRATLPAGSYDRAARALFTWRMHRAVPFLRVSPTAGEAAPGVRVVLRWGPVRAPCQVVWTVEDEDRTGFAYGTLPGHPECGEEAFVLRRLPDGTVDFTVFAISRHAAAYLRPTGPCGRWVQRAVARRYGRALRRLAAR